jgi:hypothetical protein
MRLDPHALSHTPLSSPRRRGPITTDLYEAGAVSHLGKQFGTEQIPVVVGPRLRGDDSRISYSSRALLNAKLVTRRVFSSRIRVRVIGGSARWAQFSRSQSRQLTPIGVPSAVSRFMPAA